MVVNFDPDPSLTEAQKARVLAEKTRLSQNKAAQEAIAQRDIGAVQRMSTQASADSKVSKFDEDVREEFRSRFVGPEGFYTPEGLAAINRYNDSLELKKQIGEDEFDKLVANATATGVSGPSRAAMISGKPYSPPIRSKEYLGGRLVIPEENALKDMRKMYAQKKKDALKGTVATDVEWEKFGIKFKGITNESISNDRQIAVGKALSDYLASDQWNDLGDAKERSEALATWFGTQQVASGSIKTVMGVADLNRRVQSGELKVGDMVLNLADGQFSPVSIGGQGGQPADGGGADASPPKYDKANMPSYAAAAGLTVDQAMALDSAGIDWTNSSLSPAVLAEKNLKEKKASLSKLRPSQFAISAAKSGGMIPANPALTPQERAKYEAAKNKAAEDVREAEALMKLLKSK